jgi:hypothetical protein
LPGLGLLWRVSSIFCLRITMTICWLSKRPDPGCQSHDHRS